MNRRLVTLCVAFALPFTTGCATVAVDREFVNATDLARDRAAVDLAWPGVTEDVSVAEARIDEMLAEPLDADRAVEVALLNSPRLRIEYASIGIAAADRVAAGLPSNPFLDLAVKFRGGETASIELDLVTELVDLILLPARRRIAAAQFEAARTSLASTVLETIGETRRTFYQLQAEEQLLDLERSVLIATEAQYEMARALREAGNISELDLFVDRDMYEQTKLQISSREQSVLGLREQLNAHLGLWGPRTAWRLESRLPDLPENPEVPPGLEEAAVAKSLILRRGVLDLEAIARRRGITNITATLPEIEGGVSAERESEGDHDEWSAGPLLGIRLPLFNRAGPERTRARLELMRGWDRLTADAVEVRAAARRVGRDVVFTHQQAKYVRDVLLPLRIATTAQAQLHYNGMYIGVFQLLDAKIREIDAARLLIQKLRDYWISRSRLEQVLAGGMPGELGSMSGSGLEADFLEGAEEDH